MEKISHTGKMPAWRYATRIFYTIATEHLIMWQKVFFLIITLKVGWESQKGLVFNGNVNFINNI